MYYIINQTFKTVTMKKTLITFFLCFCCFVLLSNDTYAQSTKTTNHIEECKENKDYANSAVNARGCRSSNQDYQFINGRKVGISSPEDKITSIQKKMMSLLNLQDENITAVEQRYMKLLKDLLVDQPASYNEFIATYEQEKQNRLHQQNSSH